LSSVFDSRDTPVPSEMALTAAPATTDPLLSVTVPEKLPVACPYMKEGTQSTATYASAAHNSLLLITTPPTFCSGSTAKARRYHRWHTRRSILNTNRKLRSLTFPGMRQPAPRALAHTTPNDEGNLLLNYNCVKTTCFGYRRKMRMSVAAELKIEGSELRATRTNQALLLLPTERIIRP
jgi:hypothetical protein